MISIIVKMFNSVFMVNYSKTIVNLALTILYLIIMLQQIIDLNYLDS